MNYDNLSKDELIELLILKDKPIKVNNGNDIYKYLESYRDKDQEHFIVVSLSSSMEVIKSDVVTIGTLNSTIVHPREVFIRAIENRAAAIIIAHNHPSGNLEPSTEDQELTIGMINAGKILGIEVLDHIIISKKGFFSLREENRMFKIF